MLGQISLRPPHPNHPPEAGGGDKTAHRREALVDCVGPDLSKTPHPSPPPEAGGGDKTAHRREGSVDCVGPDLAKTPTLTLG